MPHPLQHVYGWEVPPAAALGWELSTPTQVKSARKRGGRRGKGMDPPAPCMPMSTSVRRMSSITSCNGSCMRAQRGTAGTA